jgi:WD40 repeat protein
MAFSADGGHLAVNGGGTDLGSAVRLWDIARRAQVAGPQVKKQAVGLAFSKDGAYMAVSAPSLEVFDLHTNDPVSKFDCGSAPALWPVFSPNGKWVAANCGGVVTGWPFAGRGEAFHFGEAGDANNGPVVFSPDGRLLAAGRATGVLLYDLAERKVVEIVKTADPISALAFSADGELLACGGRSSLFVIHIRTWRRIWSVSVGQTISVLRFTRDGRGLLAAADSLTLYDSMNGRPLRTLVGKLPNGSVPAFSIDGEWFGTGWNSAAHLWRVRVN